MGLKNRKKQGWEITYMEDLANNDGDNIFEGQIIFNISFITTHHLQLDLLYFIKR